MIGVVDGPGRVERRDLREHLGQGERRLEAQRPSLLPDVHQRLRQGLGAGREARPDREHGAAARSPADEQLRDLSEGPHSAVSLRQSGQRTRAALSRGARPTGGRRGRRDSRSRRAHGRRARSAKPQAKEAEALIAADRAQLGRVKDFHEIDNVIERLRLLPRQESLDRSRESVLGGRHDRARATRRVHRARARARLPVQRVRPGRPAGESARQPYPMAARDSCRARTGRARRRARA